MLTSFHLDDYEHEVLGARASGFLLKVATAPEAGPRGSGAAAGDALLTRQRPAAHRRLRPLARSARLQAGRPKYCG
jgi:hypothetical protein